MQITPDTLLTAAAKSQADARLFAAMAGGNPASMFAVMAANALDGARVLASVALPPRADQAVSETRARLVDLHGADVVAALLSAPRASKVAS